MACGSLQGGPFVPRGTLIVPSYRWPFRARGPFGPAQDGRGPSGPITPSTMGNSYRNRVSFLNRLGLHSPSPIASLVLSNSGDGSSNLGRHVCPWISRSHYCPRVLVRPKRQGAAPCRFIQRRRFSSAPCRFFSGLSFSESPLVSLGFHQRYFELEVAENVQLRRKVARFCASRCYSRRTSPPSWSYDEY